MPDKHPNTERWGGPGASHENRNAEPPPRDDHRADGEPTNTRHSHQSGGGGERDIHHTDDPKLKRDFQENSDQRAKP